MIKNKKFIINLIIIMLFSMSVFGCGNEISKDSENDTKEEDITLVDPVGVTDDYDVVALKNLYQFLYVLLRLRLILSFLVQQSCL